jgi:hypothetical protein
MPARSERIYIFPDKDGEPCRIIEFPLWWDRGEFFNTYRRREVDTGSPFYLNFALLLTGWEAQAWDKRCREKFSGDPGSREPYFIEQMPKMESVLSKATWVIVESYEWESGLD